MIAPPPLTQSWPLPLRRLLVEGRRALRHGDNSTAAKAFRQALAREPNIPEAHFGLAQALRPGPGYLEWLETLHRSLHPRVYLEIGVETGRSLRLAAPDTYAFGIDPDCRLPPDWRVPPTTRIVSRSSQEFFADSEAVAAFPAPLDFAFIDGDHRFASVLHDFIAVEALAAPDAVIAIHDTWPLDAATAATVRNTGFYTGDCWKIVPCLRAIRPDLRLLTVPTLPTGLTLVTALDPASTVLRDRQESILAAFACLPYRPETAHHLALADNTPHALDQVMAWRATATAKSSRHRPVARK